MRSVILAVLVLVAGPCLVEAASPEPPAVDGGPIGSFAVRLAGGSTLVRFASRVREPGPLDTAARAAPAQLAEVEQAVARGQAAVVAAIGDLGAAVVSRYTTAANGLLVHATAGEVARIRRLPGVLAVEAAPRVRPQLRQSVPFVGATALGALKGYHGEGTVIAIVDTGIDYTHADFGGPGTDAAYAAAAADSTRTDETWQGKPLFPTAKVIGGWDFVGPNYSSPSGCTPELEAAGKCTTTPHPDPDPLDQYGHGSHVAGIAAGVGTPSGTVLPGMAPAAGLVALKIYGPPKSGVYVDEASDVVIDAIEWCVKVNLGLPAPGALPPRVDVINMSLGEDWGQGSQLFDEAAGAATAAGIVVAAAAGNSGDRPYIVNAPGASPSILSVANAYPPGSGIRVPVHSAVGDTSVVAVEARFTPLLRTVGRIEAPLVGVGSACGPDPLPADVRGKVVLADAGDCADDAKVVAVGQAGGVAAFVASSGGASAMYGSLASTVPGFSVSLNDAGTLRARLAAGAVTVVLDADADVGADAVNASSARGPSRHGPLKLDITAPGSGIISAAYATGDGAQNSSGTSMATPHVAGAAALLAQRNRVEGLDLRAPDLAALLMNYARADVYVAVGEQHVPVPAARQGSGRLDVAAAGTGSVLVRSGDIASANFGVVAVRSPRTLTVPLAVRNLSGAAVRLQPAARFWRADDPGRGARFGQLDAVDVPANGRVTVPLSLVLDPAALRPWALRGAQSVGTTVLTSLELDGDITLQPVDVAGQPIPGGLAPHVPFYALPRAASSAWAERVEAPTATQTGALHLTNRSAVDGGAGMAARVELFPLPRGAAQPDPPDATDDLDVAHVAVRFDGRAGTDVDRLTFGIALRQLAAQPQHTSFELYLDTNRDGATDWRVRSLTESRLASGGLEDKVVVTVTPWDATTGGPAGDERTVSSLGAEMHSRTVLLAVPLVALGLSVPPTLDFYLVHRGLTEDWPVGAATDVAPDGADAGAGARYTFDATQTGWWPRPASLALAPDEVRDVTLAPGAAPPGLLAFYPDNVLEPFAAQVQLLQLPGAGGVLASPPWTEAERVYLPQALRPRP